MDFEVKKVETVGGVSSKDENTSQQWLNITVGVVGCPYDDIIATQTVAYEFANTMTVADARAGIDPFAAAWVVTNYPNTV